MNLELVIFAWVFGIGVLLILLLALWSRWLQPMPPLFKDLPSIRLDLSDPRNRDVLDFLRSKAQGDWAVQLVELGMEESVQRRQFAAVLQHNRLDEVEALWKEAASNLPEDCRSVVYGRPALVHPESGVIFGFLVGTAMAWREPRGFEPSTIRQSEAPAGYAEWRRTVKGVGADWEVFLPGHSSRSWWQEVYRNAGEDGS